VDRKPSEILSEWVNASALMRRRLGVEIQLSSASSNEHDGSRGITLAASGREAYVRLHPSGDCDADVCDPDLCALSFGLDSLEYLAVIEYHRLTNERELEDIFTYVVDYILLDEKFDPPSIDELPSWLSVNKQRLEEDHIEADTTIDDTNHAWFINGQAQSYVPNRRLNLRAMGRVGKATLASNGRFYMQVDLVDDEHSGMTVHSGYSIVRSKGQLMRQMDRVVRYLSGM
jgi:hypothetical protein